jgi:phosphopentomutase
MQRVFVLVLDSLGVGALPDAADFGDVGAHTLDHIVQATGGLDVPRLRALGLGNIDGVEALEAAAAPQAAYGRMAEVSPGKDTSTGHWEMMGCPLASAFPVFPEGFPAALMAEFVQRNGLPGYLGNEPASGTEILARLGPEHVATGKPIVYTSADSVFQVAAHEESFGLQRLHDVCSVARELLRPLGVGRVIARPFLGSAGAYERTYNRRDYSLEPPGETVLERLATAGRDVIAVGKIDDIFCGRGITRALHSAGNRDGMQQTIQLARDGASGLIFVNLVDFDMLYGHRRDPAGYRSALEEFDGQLVQLEQQLGDDDLVLLTADHGNDPTRTGNTDHTREYVPVLALGPRVKPGNLGTRKSFADLGATVEEALGLRPSGPGKSFYLHLLA